MHMYIYVYPTYESQESYKRRKMTYFLKSQWTDIIRPISVNTFVPPTKNDIPEQDLK